MAKFKLVSGTHTDEKGKSYKVGDVVTSDLPLTEMFVNHFEKVSEVRGKDSDKEGVRGSTKSSRRDEDDAFDEEEEEDDIDITVEPDKSGDPERRKRKEKIRQLGKKMKAESGEGSEESGEGSEESGEEVPEEFGVDVTDDFPGAREGQLRVFSNDESGVFTVVLAEKPTKSLADQPLKSRKATLKCVSMNAVPTS